jgi:hypothetical protein
MLVHQGEYLVNAAGEDVVAGIRTPVNLRVRIMEGCEGFISRFSYIICF